MRLSPIVAIVTIVMFATGVTKADEQSDIAAIQGLFTRYIALWNEGNTDAIGVEIYSMPVLSLRPDGSRVVIQTREDLAKRWKAFRDQGIKNGNGMTKIESSQICLVGNGVAIAALTYSVQRSGDQSIKDGWFYMLQKTDGMWHNVLITPRNVDTSISCRS